METPVASPRRTCHVELVEIYYSKGLFELLKCGKFTHYYQIQVHDFTNFTIVLSRPTNKKPPASLCTCRETLPENRVNELVTHDFTNLLLSFYYGAVTKTQKPASLCTCRETQRENRVQWNQVICHSESSHQKSVKPASC